MDERTLRVLEYAQIKALLAREAGSTVAKERVEQLSPSTDFEVVSHLLAETSEARALLDEEGSIPLGGVHDIRESVDLAGKGGVLEPDALLDIAATAAASRRLRGFLLNVRDDYPLLAEYAGQLEIFRDLEDAIDRALTGEGQVRDDASPELVRARQRVRSLNHSVHTRLEAIINSPAYRRMVQEPIITIRNERLCVPVRSEFKGEFKGIVHDASASGATLFMEPLSVVELNNELREAQRREQEEIRRVLARLSAQVADLAGSLLMSLEGLAAVDFIAARAKLSQSMDASPPQVNREGIIELSAARHPLLAGKVVPIDMRLGDGFNTLVITGPNTGGKTVALKTVGLLTLMAQSGLHIPSSEGSRVAMFGQVFADIGDEQSIQQNLSTFSSHMSQIVSIMRQVQPNALVLLDEIGAGTDPSEGAALAKALLSVLHSLDARTVATTHYGELKAFAFSEPGIENASVEFDPETLRPLYRVQIGLPGSSNAFAIAQRLGLPASVLETAESMMGAVRTHLDRGIEQVEATHRALEAERLAVDQQRSEVERLKAEYERLTADLQARRSKLIHQAREEARALLEEARAEITDMVESTRAALREARKRDHRGPGPVEIKRAARERTARIEESVGPPEPVEPAPEARAEPARRSPRAVRGRPGEEVWVRPLRQKGTIQSLPDQEGDVEVQVGILRVKARVTDLEPLPEAVGSAAPDSPVAQIQTAKAQVSPELNLVGQRVADAIYELEKYLDDALVGGLAEVRIIHGLGTGALRSAVGETLERHPHVADYRPAEREQGGAGATVVRLRSPGEPPPAVAPDAHPDPAE
ncbi:hypothetical protein AMK68_01485 [candidate division KD3-62 bacterium DG_56]|uniref:Endonuclease MutS2 n=1 Tax=candidate division KD3-62 bacterium DG_56 TaxID=1704032 RepID=A0A0S7XPT2_9BACT|nr:MAG: hypothetical protein AMK68_01485 [candidate division KD3-62 bacterium DG_56]